MFLFIQKAFKHNNSFVDVGGILCAASFSSQSAGLAERGSCLGCCIPAVLRRWGAVEVVAILRKSRLRFRLSWCKKTQNVKSYLAALRFSVQFGK